MHSPHQPFETLMLTDGLIMPMTATARTP
jgi:hypothetical protein